MNKTIKLLGAAAMMLSLGGYASAGALDELMFSQPAGVVAAGIQMPTPPAPVAYPKPDTVQYVTGVKYSYVDEVVWDYFANGATVLNVGATVVFKLPPHHIAYPNADTSIYGYAVLASSAAPESLPAANWKVLKEYKVSEYELAAALNRLMSSHPSFVLEITNQKNGGYIIKKKDNPWF